MKNYIKCIIIITIFLTFSSCVFWEFTSDRQVCVYDLGLYSDGIIGLECYKNYVYLLNKSFGIIPIDVSDPGNPRIMINGITGDLSSEANSSQIENIYFYNNYAYTKNNIYDVSDPAAPVWVASLSLSSHFFVLDEYIYNGNEIYSLLDPENPVVVSDTSSSGTYVGRATCVSGDYVYLGSPFHIVDASDRTNPVVVGSLGIFASEIVINGDFAYLLVDGFEYSDGNIGIVDIRDKNNPKAVYIDGKVYIDGREVSKYDTLIVNNTLFVNDGFLYVYDITNPSVLKQIDMTAKNGGGEFFEISGDYLFSAGGESRYLVVMLISDYI